MPPLYNEILLSASCIWKNLNWLKNCTVYDVLFFLYTSNEFGRMSRSVLRTSLFNLIFLLKTLNFTKISVNIEVTENITKKPHKFPALQNSFNRINWISGQNEPYKWSHLFPWDPQGTNTSPSNVRHIDIISREKNIKWSFENDNWNFFYYLQLVYF